MDQQQWMALRPAIVKLRASIMAIVFGTLCGAGLMLGTAWLLVRGGTDVGVHLELLSNYYPGYSVTWVGALVGFFYGALTGSVVGYSVSWIYNTIALKRLDNFSPKP